MNKLVLLNEVKKEKKKVNNNVNEKRKSIENKYVDFRNSIFNNKFNLKINENNLSDTLSKLFLLNKKVFIEFINYIFNDYLRTNSRVEFSKEIKDNKCLLNNPSYACKAVVKDEYRNYEYRVELQTNDIENIAILILKNDLNKDKSNVVNFRKKKEEYESIVENKLEQSKSNLCILMLNSNIPIPDTYKIYDNFEKCSDEIKVIKVWKYDFKDLFENKLSLLFPIKILDLKNMIDSLKNIDNSHKVIEEEINRFYLKMNIYLEKLKENELIDEKDIELIKEINQNILKIIYK